MTTGVSIDVDLDIGKAMGKIMALKAQLKTLDDDLDIGLDSDDIGELEVEDLELSDSSERKLTRQPSPLSPEGRGAKSRGFSFREIFDDIDINTGGGGGSSGGGGGGVSIPGSGARKKQKNKTLGVENNIKKLLPTDMRKWYRLLAIMLPSLVTFVGLLAGVASAMGGVAVAGASLIGLGLLGWGDSLSESMAEAKKRVKEFGTELFNVLQAPMKSFAPISEGFLDMVTGEMTRLVEPLQGLTVFEDTVRQAGRGIIGFAAEAINGLVKYEEKISEIALAFGNLVGHSILNFFGFVINFADEGGEVLRQLASTLKIIILTLFEFSEVLSTVFVAFRSVFYVLYKVGKILSNSFVMAVISGIAVSIMLNKVLWKLHGQLYATFGPAVMSNVWNFFNIWYQGSLKAATGTYNLQWAMQGLRTAMQSVIPLIGPIIGLASMFDMMSGFDAPISTGESFGSSGNGNYVNRTEINIQGDADSKSMEEMKDVAQEEDGILDLRSMPGGQ